MVASSPIEARLAVLFDGTMDWQKLFLFKTNIKETYERRQTSRHMYEKYMRNNANFYHIRMHMIVHDVKVNKFERQNYGLSNRSKEYSIILD